ncbi:hypothetical protein IW152_002075 [Coemansia sp. BCRC 34962]|nr:hypothetical protein IW152_002075 [Coemansia sp. BCRC 34962]
MEKGMYLEHEPAELVLRRQKLMRDLEGRGKSMGFLKLLDKLGLADAYETYNESVPIESFESLADSSLVIHQSTSTGSEAAYVDTFKKLLDSLSAKVDMTALPTEYQKTPYIYKDNQAQAVRGSKLKPDLTLYQKVSETQAVSTAQIVIEAKQQISETAASCKHLGQFADYALEIWKHQPLRTFVPLLLLLGCDLYLVVFTREGYYSAEMGQVLYRCEEGLTTGVYTVRLGLRKLWFLARYDNKDVILKISSTPTNRFPEGALYDVLATKDANDNLLVSGIPHVYMSGILANDVDGYRVEFLLMEDCGKTIVEFFADLRQSEVSAAEIANKAKKCVSSVIQTLAEARHVSVLQRHFSWECHD